MLQIKRWSTVGIIPEDSGVSFDIDKSYNYYITYMAWLLLWYCNLFEYCHLTRVKMIDKEPGNIIFIKRPPST